jgi:formylglycine-generating enzyme required for sulfatase activity/tRNA A-37 threonylcarbamoyl transferase component Bud32
MQALNVRDLEGREITDRLRLDRALRVGQHSYIFEGSLLSLGRSIGRCAVKLCRLKDRYQPDSFLQELREQSHLSHPNLINVNSAGLVEQGPALGWVYVALELAEYSLQDLLDQGARMPHRAVTEMLLHVSEAIAYLHSQNIAHTEVRPSNILFAQQSWKLSGLEYRASLARRLEEVNSNENHFVFRSPEMLENQIENPSGDLWSLAVVAHACLTSRLPFAETSDLSRGDLVWRIIHQEPEPEALGEPFDTMVERALRRKIDSRVSAIDIHYCLGGAHLDFALPESSQPVVQDSSPEQAPPEVSEGSQDHSRSVDFRSLVPIAAAIFVVMAALLIAVGVLWGYSQVPKRGKLRQNVKSADLRTRNFEIGSLDQRGRSSSQMGSAPALMEVIGQGINLALIQIPTGEFDMGSPTNESYRENNESPQHRVKLDAFYMTQTEISQAQWREVAKLPPVKRELPLSPSKVGGAALPVHNVSYLECQEFCARLRQKTGRFFRLPTEAEWEYACRGGPSLSPFHFGPTLTSEVATFKGSKPYLSNFPPGIDPVAPTAVSFHSKTNPFGLIDMHGNVKEWCQDGYEGYSEARQDNPTGPAGPERVVRGGGFQTFAWNCRSARRDHLPETSEQSDLGFRIVAPERCEVKE